MRTLSGEDISFYSSAFGGLSMEEISAIVNMAHHRKLKAGEIYIHVGSLSQRIAYIRQGLIRTYLIKENGDEVTLLLRWENQFIASTDTILHQRPSNFYYRALEDTILLEFDYQKSKPVIDMNAKLSAFRNHVLMDMLTQAMERIADFVFLSPEDRYKNLLAEKPDLINRVPDKYLATMLGITSVSLSRIRKRIAKSAQVLINKG